MEGINYQVKELGIEPTMTVDTLGYLEGVSLITVDSMF